MEDTILQKKNAQSTAVLIFKDIGVNKSVPHKYTIVVLYNDLKENNKSGSLNVFAPDRNKAMRKLREAGYDFEILHASGMPRNPFGKAPDAYRGLDPLRALKVLLTRRKVDLVYAHLESAVLLLLLRKMFFFKPPILIWEVPWSPGWRYRNIISRIVLSRADCAVVFGSNQIEIIHSLYGAHHQVEFVPFWVDFDFYRPMVNATNKNPYLLSVGLDPGRDLKTILKAINGLTVPLTIKASSRLIPFDIKKYPNVYVETRWLSYVEYRNLYRGASVVIISTKETPNACGVTSLLEAYAMGKATIVSDNPGLRDYLPPPEAGIIVPVNDPNALRFAILELINKPEKAAAMGKNARDFAQNKFNSENYVSAGIKVLKQLTNGHE